MRQFDQSGSHKAEQVIRQNQEILAYPQFQNTHFTDSGVKFLPSPGYLANISICTNMSHTHSHLDHTHTDNTKSHSSITNIPGRDTGAPTVDEPCWIRATSNVERRVEPALSGRDRRGGRGMGACGVGCVQAPGWLPKVDGMKGKHCACCCWWYSCGTKHGKSLQFYHGELTLCSQTHTFTTTAKQTQTHTFMTTAKDHTLCRNG